jgi:hypothetical protein
MSRSLSLLLSLGGECCTIQHIMATQSYIAQQSIIEIDEGLTTERVAP